MFNLKASLFTVLFAASSALAQDSGALERMRSDVTYLSDDKLEGRATGSEGERMAAEFISKRYAEIGLSAAGQTGFYQDFSRKQEADPHSTSTTDTSTIIGRNVIGLLDNGAEHTVVIGAHYDHLGWGEFGSLHTGEPAIHNGADDNASGVALMIELAKKIKDEGWKGNNYLFIAFSGEERGLWGSTYFMREPTIAQSSINYMINFDMVGRLNDEKTLAVHGSGTSPVWKSTVDAANSEGLKLVYSESGVGPSDHTQFYLKDIPVLHFFTGQHDDYHRPSDDVEKVNFEGMVTVGALVEKVMKELDDDGKLEFTKTKDSSPGDTPRFTVTLGVVPDYLFDGKGLRIAGVKDDRPASKAKLKAGDVVLKLGDFDVTDMMAYMKALAEFKKGDKTSVVVDRDGKTVKRKIQF